MNPPTGLNSASTPQFFIHILLGQPKNFQAEKKTTVYINRYETQLQFLKNGAL